MQHATNFCIIALSKPNGLNEMNTTERTITNVDHLAYLIKEASDFSIKQAEFAIEIIAVIKNNFSDFFSYDIYTKKLSGAHNPFLMTQTIGVNFNLKGRKMVTAQIDATEKTHNMIVSEITEQLDHKMINIDVDVNDEDSEEI